MILTIETQNGQHLTKYYSTEQRGRAAFYYYRRKAQAGEISALTMFLVTDPTIDKSEPRWIYNGGKVIKSYVLPEPADDEAEQLKKLLLTSYFIGGNRQ